LKIKLLIIILSFTSCNFFTDQTILEKELLNKRINEIDWKKVDRFPTISSCDLINDKNLQKKCLFEFIEQTIKEKLNSNLSNKKSLKTDTVLVKVCISEFGKLDFETENNKKLDSILKTALLGFPRIMPALKQGIYVKTKFDLNIVYQSN
jgi:hypothetical protein